MELTQERLMEVVVYDPAKGTFKRKCEPSRRHPNGRVKNTGTRTTKGYISIFVDGSKYLAHRLAWLYMTGDCPQDQIDHIDKNPGNNAWRNLREANNSQNQANTGVRKDNRVGLKGAHYFSKTGQWTSRIRANGEDRFLGYFETPEQAHKAYTLAAASIHGEFARAA